MLAARRKANWILAAILIPLTLLTLAAMAFMWPSGSKEGLTLASPYAAAPGVTCRHRQDPAGRRRQLFGCPGRR